MGVFIDYDGLKARGIKYSRQHLLRLEKAGRFPKRVQFSPNGRPHWDAAEVDALQNKLRAGREHAERGAAV